MKVHFSKYQGTGNDFIIIDNRNNNFSNYNSSLISVLCNRQLGIGADGLILLNNKSGFDFQMIYFNSDGNQSSMCGNGGRCIVAYALKLGIIKEKASFIAIDGQHEAVIVEDKSDYSIVKLKMSDVLEIENNKSYFFLNTGSPHYVQYVENIEKFDVINNGRAIRNNERFFSEGTNVNFIENKDDYLYVRTYERGVENETLSCGTGVTASALVAAINENNQQNFNKCKIKTLGGSLIVHFEKESDFAFKNIWLEGAATFVFNGEIDI